MADIILKARSVGNSILQKIMNTVFFLLFFAISQYKIIVSGEARKKFPEEK